MQEIKERNMVIKLLEKIMNNDELDIGKIFILVGKLVLGISIASIIYIFYKFISLTDIKITFAIFEAKICSLFSSTYKVSYTNQQGIRLEKYILLFLNDPDVEYVLLKYKLALYNGLNLAFFMISTIALMIWCYRSEINAIIADFKYQLLREKQQIKENNLEPFQPKIVSQKKDKEPIEFQDL